MKRLVLALSCLYLIAMALGAASLGGQIAVPVPGYRLSIFWMSDDTLHHRIAALLAAGRGFEANVYAGMHAASWGFIATMAAIGLVRPLLGPSEPVAPIRAAAIVFGGLALLLLLAAWSRPLLDAASVVPSASATLSSLPVYWILGMAASTAVTACHLSLVLHDLTLWALGHGPEREVETPAAEPALQETPPPAP